MGLSGISGILELAALPAKMEVEQATGDATVAIVKSVTGQIVTSTKEKSEQNALKKRQEQLAVFKAECDTFNQLCTRVEFSKWLTNQSTYIGVNIV